MMNITQGQVQNQPEKITEKHIRILLIDDDTQDVETLRHMISAHEEIEFFHSSDTLRALDVASDIQPTVILQSFMMSNANSLDLVRAFRGHKETAEVPIVVLISKDDEVDSKALIFSAGADDCLPKVSSEIEIMSRIRYHSRACIEHQALKEAINELEDTRAQIFKSEKMASIGQLAAGVAHEINNPVAFVTSNLNSMSGYYDDVFSVIDTYSLLEVGLSADLPEVKAVKEIKERLQMGFIKEDIEQILSECKDGLTRIRKIVGDLKNFSRKEVVEWQLADLHKEIDSTLNIANHEIKYKAEVKKNYGDIPDIECISSQLNQVFLNLFINAAHAIDDHGTITITTSTATLPEGFSDADTGAENTDGDSWVCISVADTGSGIESETIQHIFDVFFTTKPVGQGTGLGLSLSRNIVQKHGGHMVVDSEQGKGAKFSVWLPVRQPDMTDD